MTPSAIPFWHQPYAVTTSLTAVLATPLAIFVLLKNPRSLAARWWGILCLCVAGFSFWFAVSFTSPAADEALRCLLIADAFSLFIPITYLHFAMHFVGQVKRWWLMCGYVVTTLLAMTVGSPWFIPKVEWKFGMWFAVGGPTLFVFAIIFLVLPGYGMWLLWDAARQSSGTRRAQLICALVASLIGFGGGFMWFPPCFGVDIPPLGGHIIALYCVTILYAIVRYQFLDVRVVIRRSLVYSILVTLLTVGYFGAVYALEQLFQTTLGYQSVGTSVAAFALMALLFQPIKIAIQRMVDRLIFHAPQQSVAKRLELYEVQAREGARYKVVATLAAGVAHELKNPLAAIQTFLDFFPKKRTDPEFQQQFYEIVAGEIWNLHAIAQGLLEFGRPQKAQRSATEISDVLQGVLALARPELSAKQITVRTIYAHNGARILADAGQLKQVFLNLILNAKDAMERGGTLTLYSGAVNGCVEVHVADTGGRGTTFILRFPLISTDPSH